MMNDSQQNIYATNGFDAIPRWNGVENDIHGCKFTPGAEIKGYGGCKSRVSRPRKITNPHTALENDGMAWSPSVEENIVNQFKSSVLLGSDHPRPCFSPGHEEKKTLSRREKRSFAIQRRIGRQVHENANTSSISVHPETLVNGSYGDKRTTRSEASAASEIRRLRIQGNEAFKSQDYNLACTKYSSSICAIKRLPVEMHRCFGLPLLFCNRAAAYLALGKPQEAYEDCKCGISIDKMFTKCYIRSATCLIRMGRFGEARDILDRAPTCPEVVSKKGELCDTEKRFLFFFEQAGILENGPTEDVTEFKCLSSMIDSYREIEAIVPHSSALLACAVATHIRFGDFSGADRILERVLKMDSNNPPTWAGWCRVQTCYFKADYGQCSRNLASLKHILSPSDQTDDDIALLKEIIPIPENSSLAYMENKIKEIDTMKMQSNRMMNAGKYIQAIELYTKALATGPLSPAMAAILFSNRAAAYHALHNRALALADCCNSISILPNYPKPYSRIANILFELGLFHDAQKFMKKAISHTHESNKAAEYQAYLNQIRAKSSNGDNRNHTFLLLGIDESANSSDSKKAYRKLALKLHPDKALSSIKVHYQLENGILLQAEPQMKKDIVEHATWLFKLLGEAQEHFDQS